MAINWPTIAQGAGTGTTYTPPSPNYNTWTWNGYAWTSKSTTPSGGFGGPWVIFDQYGKARYFPILQQAIDYASPGETINLFQNIREIITEDYHVILRKDININLNGFEYILDANSDLTRTGYAISTAELFDFDGSVATVYEVDVKIYNGKISLINVVNSGEPSHAVPLILIGEPYDSVSSITNLNFGSNWVFNNVIFESCANEQYVGRFCSNVSGGIFYSNELVKSVHGGAGVGLHALNKSPNKLLTTFRNVTGISETGSGIIHYHNDIGFSRTFLIGCKGESRKSTNNYPARGILGFNQEAFGGMLYNCTGIATKILNPYIEGSGYYISGMRVGRSVKAVKCTGFTISDGIGIETNSATLAHCIGKSEYTGFRSYSGTQFKLCSNGYSPSMSNGLIVSSAIPNITYLNGDSIENCSLEGTNSAITRDSIQHSEGHYVNVFNSVLKGGNSGIEVSYYTGSQLRAANNVISYNEDSAGGLVSSIILGGATGSVVANNVLKGSGGSVNNGSYAIRCSNSGSTGTIYMAGNSCVNYDSMIRPNNTPFPSNIIQGMTATVSNNFGNITQPYYPTQNT